MPGTIPNSVQSSAKAIEGPIGSRRTRFSIAGACRHAFRQRRAWGRRKGETECSSPSMELRYWSPLMPYGGFRSPPLAAARRRFRLKARCRAARIAIRGSAPGGREWRSRRKYDSVPDRLMQTNTMETRVTKALLAGLVSACVVLASFSAVAGHNQHRGHNRIGHHHGNGDVLIAASIIGGAIILGTILSQPRDNHHRHYYRPTYGPRCFQDNVWRYLPDGRIQWGTRTTCH